MSGEFNITEEALRKHQATIDRLAASQAGRMSMQAIDTLSSEDPLRQYAEARMALRGAGLSGEPSAMSQTLTPPIGARMRPY